MHRYPGIRSDSDLHTFGYRFKPWTGAPIATAEEILSYMGEVIISLDTHTTERLELWRGCIVFNFREQASRTRRLFLHKLSSLTWVRD